MWFLAALCVCSHLHQIRATRHVVAIIFERQGARLTNGFQGGKVNDTVDGMLKTLYGLGTEVRNA